MDGALSSFTQNDKDICAYFKRILDFLKEFRWIYDVNMTKIFCVDSFSHIPKEWCDVLTQLSNRELNEIPYGFCKDSWPDSLKLFLTNAIEFGAFRFQDTVTNLQQNNLTEISVPPLLKRGMSPKKLIEVTQLAKEIDQVCKVTGCSAVLDIGSGLGYLGQVLHLNFGYYVLGIEGDSAHCEKAISRQDKIISCENVQSKAYCLSEDANNQTSPEELLNILSDTNIPIPCNCSINKPSTIPNLNNGWVLVSLHACGPLTPLILELFVNNTQFKAVVCVGCCYHKFYNKESRLNFPSSNSLKSVIKINEENDESIVYGLRLASQETKSRWREKSMEDHDEHIKHLAYRGILEAFLASIPEQNQWQKPLRRMPKSAYKSFKTYYTKALSNQPNLLDGHEHLIEELMKKNEHLFPLLEVFTLLQVLLQPVWESLIIMDRCRYLKENEFDSYIKNFISDRESPRNLAIISYKGSRV